MKEETLKINNKICTIIDLPFLKHTILEQDTKLLRN